MEVKKQANCTHLTPEQVKSNLAQSKHNWYLNNKDYCKPGGHGYECLTRVLTCGREVKAIKLRRHQRSRLHKKALASCASFRINYKAKFSLMINFQQHIVLMALLK